MKNKILKCIFLMLFFIVFIFGKSVNAQCPGFGYTYMTINLVVGEDCDSVYRGNGCLLFWTGTPTILDSFTVCADSTGVIHFCFENPDSTWFMKGVDPSDCKWCTNYFVPNNLPGATTIYRYACNPECYCKSNRPNSNTYNENSSINQFVLHPNYPNPFNPVTNIQFDLPKDSYVKLKVYDLSGEEIITLIDGKYTAGNYNVDFNGNNFSSGVYFYKLETPDFISVRKMVLIK